MGVKIYRRAGVEVADAGGRLGEALRRRFDRYPEVQAIVMGGGPPASQGYRVVRPPALCDVHYLRRAGDGQLRWAGAVWLDSVEYPSLRRALAIVARRLMPVGHGYIVHTYRRFQVVDRARVFGGGDLRPMAHMAFDGGAANFGSIVRLLRSPWGDRLLEYSVGGIPCLGLPLEGDPVAMEETLHDLDAAINSPRLRRRRRIPAYVHDEEPPGPGAAFFLSKRGKFEEVTAGVITAISSSPFRR